MSEREPRFDAFATELKQQLRDTWMQICKAPGHVDPAEAFRLLANCIDEAIARSEGDV